MPLPEEDTEILLTKAFSGNLESQRCPLAEREWSLMIYVYCIALAHTFMETWVVNMFHAFHLDKELFHLPRGWEA